MNNNRTAAIIMLVAPKHANTLFLRIGYLGTISALLALTVSQHHLPLDLLIISVSLLARPSFLCIRSCLTLPEPPGCIRWPMCKRCAVS